MNQAKVLCFGELLYRLQAVDDQFFKAENSPILLFPGGSEANVASCLGQLNIDTSYVSAAPDHPLSRAILQQLHQNHVETNHFIFSGNRLGSYILLGANGLSTGEVIYDRDFSSFSQLQSQQLDWEKIFEDITWFHWSAITVSLNLNLALILKDALKIAKKKNIYISVDLNYRNKLWQYGIKPDEIMPELTMYCDLIMGNIWAANSMLGTSIDQNFNVDTSSQSYIQFANEHAQEVFEKFPNCKQLAYTFRFMKNAKHNKLFGTYHTQNGNYTSEVFESYAIIDRIGSGDAFMAGLIAATIKGYAEQDLINDATEIAFNKLFQLGDFAKINL